MVVENPVMMEDAVIEFFVKRTHVFSKSTAALTQPTSYSTTVNDLDQCLVNFEGTLREAVLNVDRFNSDALGAIDR